MTDLNEILRSDDADALQARLDEGLDPNCSGPGLETPLGTATREGARRCMRLLLERGAAVDAGYPSPIDIAIEAGRADLVRILISARATIRGPEKYDPDYPAPIVVAVEAADPAVVGTLLEAGCLEGESWPVVDDAFRSALDLQGRAKWKILELLAVHLARAGVELPPSAGSVLRAVNGLKPRAKKAGNRAFAEAVEVLSGQLDQGKAELDEAEDAFLEMRFDDLFELIASVPEARRDALLGLVAVCACGGCYYFSQWLIELGASTMLCDAEGMTALMHCARHGSSYLTQPLTGAGRAALVDAVDDSGRTAVDHLAERGEYQFAHAIELDLTYPYRRTPERTSAPLRPTECSAYVRRAGELARGHRVPELLAHLGSVDRTEREWQLAAGAAVLEDAINDCMTLLEHCLDQGADLNVRNDFGAAALHDACGLHHLPRRVLQRIVEGGADLTARELRFQKRTVLEIARSTWPPEHECRVLIEGLVAGGTDPLS